MSVLSWPVRAPRLGRHLLLEAALLTLVVVGVQQVLHEHVGDSAQGAPLLRWVTNLAPLLPVALVVVVLGRYLAARDPEERGRIEPWLFAPLVGGAVFALLAVPAQAVHARLFDVEQAHMWFLRHAGTDGMSVWMVAAAGMLATALVRRVAQRRLGQRRVGQRRPALRRPVAVTLSSALIAPTALLSLTPSPAAAETSTQTPTCPATRTYDVAAIDLDIPYNRWGQRDADGMMYVLQQDKAAVKNWDVPLDHVRGPDGTYVPGTDPANGRRLRPRPLVLRANAGDCVNVTLTNELSPRQFGGTLADPRASIHINGVTYNVQDSDGSAVGFNDDTTVAIGESITYRWVAPEEGVYLFQDRGSMAGSEADGGSTVHGLFGALAVEPAGSTWTDPVSGARLDGGTTGPTTPYQDPVTRQQSGDLYIDADIHPPAAKSFRESVQLAQDEIPGIGFGFNYGSEPQEEREKALCPDCVGEETSLSSWTYGDPALVKLASGKGPWLPTPGNTAVEDCGLPGSCYVSNVTHAYRWDATKFRYGLAGVKETHVFHMHAHQWLAEPNDTGTMTDGRPSDSKRPESITVDSQTFGPGDMFTADLLYGAGSQPGTVGDSIFHCHLYPHFAAGFWALFRVHDVREDGTATTPDGINVRNLEPLPTGVNPPAATPDNPGYPRFIPGEFGWRAPQAPGSVTEGGPNGTPATRIVAGKPLDPAKVAVERAVQLRSYGGAEPKPGAPLTDPCPPGAREVTYNVSVIQRDIVYNEGGWHDTQGRLLVLDKDVEAVLAGTKQPEPLFIRVQSGDCINFNLTNLLPNWVGNDAFLKLTQTNMVGEHIHLVKFDVLGSDGASNGWNYQQAAFSKTQSDFNNQLLDGTRSCTRDEAQGACRLPLPESYDPSWSGQMPGQTIHQRWYADYELRTVFTHDHHFPAVDQNRGLYGALLVEPKGTDFRDPQTGEFFAPSSSLCSVSCEGSAAGASMDVIGPGANDDFREFGLSFQDFVSLTKPGGNPQVASDVFNPPDAPENIPDADPGVMAINYRNAPFVLRDTKNGAWVDPAYRFSSTVFGDPKTPLLQAYARDNVRIRMIGGSQEEQHIFALHGMRWRDEPDDPQSPLVNQRALGLSDALNFEIPAMDCGVEEDCQGDYLYSSTSTDATYLGMWGLMRVYGKGTNTLLPLPDNIPQAANGNVHFAVTGEAPPMANKPGTPCAPSAPVKAFHVIATDGKITYNEAGDHDPYGLMYGLVLPGETPEQAAARVRANPEPLVIRANEGDCLEVRLTNKIDPAGRFATEHAPKGAAIDPHGGDPSLPLEGPAGTRAGLRVSLHPQVVKYDVRGSDGATVGFNRDQTVGPDQSILYRWWADDVTPGEIGATNLVDFGDVRGHRHHGLFAGLAIEPKNATYHDPYTGAEVSSGEAADIRVPGQKDFREFTTFFQDGLNLRDSTGAFIEPPVHDGEPLDAEDEGEKGFNYASEPFRHRIGEPVQATTENPTDGQALARVFSSKIHGDPSTPVFRAYAGDPVRMRVLQGSDKPRQHAFQQSGHSWRSQPHDPGSTTISTQGGMSVSRAVNVHLPSAGGPDAVPGDYKYNCAVFFHHQSGGLWGITRVYPKPAAGEVFEPTPLAAVDDPRAPGNTPIMPLDQVTVSASVFDDSNTDRAHGNGEGAVPGVEMRLVRRASGPDAKPYTADDVVTELDRRTTGPDGRVAFQAAPGVYDVEPVVPADWAETTPTSVRVDASSDNARRGAAFGMVRLADATVHTFKDSDGDNVLGAGERDLAGWQVTLADDGAAREATTDASGLARFEGLRPGSYTATVVPNAGWFNTRPVPVTVEVGENESLNVSDGTDVRIGYALKAGLNVQLFNDSDGNGAQGTGESRLAGWEVTATGGPPGVSVTARGTTNAHGIVTFDDPDPAIEGLRPGSYTITQSAKKDWTFGSATATTMSGDVSAGTPEFGCLDGKCSTVLIDDTTQVVTIGNRNPNARVEAAPYNDANNDGKRQERESKLVGWRAELFAADGVTPVVPKGSRTNTTVVGGSGVAGFYPLPPGTYTVRMTAPPKSDDPTVLDWVGTTASSVTTTVVAGETNRSSFGFAQLGTVGATVFSDGDRDGVYSEGFEVPLANRNVRLYDKVGDQLLARGFTDASGHVAFQATAGTDYLLEVLVPDGSQATAPLTSNGSPVTTMKVTGPSDTSSANVLFGQYEEFDTTPPPNPVATPAGGTYDSEQTVSLVSETGARIRYTLDGSTPTATYGQVYTGPVTITSAKTLKAVAVDAAGNLSGVSTQVYEFANTTSTGEALTTAAPAPADTWTMSSGSVATGSVSNLAGDDGSYLLMRSATSGNDEVVQAYGAYTVPVEQRDMTALTVAYDGAASTAGLTRNLHLYDFSTGKWEAIRSETQTAGDMTAMMDVSGDPRRFLSAAGQIRMRVSASHGSTYDLKADLMTFAVTYK